MKSNIFFESKKRCKFFRKRILDLSQKVSALHIGGSFSCAEIMDLIFNILSNEKERNLFILWRSLFDVIFLGVAIGVAIGVAFFMLKSAQLIISKE